VTTGQIGFEFDFFGVKTSIVEISRDGQVSFGGATISPFSLGGLDSDFFWQNTTDSPLPGFPDIKRGFRVCWGCEQENPPGTLPEFQLALFDLGGGQYAMEFNYGGLPAEEEAFIGYDNGDGVSFDMLAALGLDFSDWAGIGAELCPPPDTPPGTATALACNNYDFSAGSDELPTGYGGYFSTYPSDPDEEVVGRYFFFIGEQADVPEPGTGLLLITGLAALRLARRRSR
jgi:hypothetical protein